MKSGIHLKLESHRSQPPNLWWSYLALEILIYALAIIAITPWFIWSCWHHDRILLSVILMISWLLSITVTLQAVFRRHMDRLSVAFLALISFAMLALCAFIVVAPAPQPTARPEPAPSNAHR